jgi:hypothetical protein
MTRTAYNHLLEGLGPRAISFLLKERYGVTDTQWRTNAIILANGIIESQKRSLPLHVEEYEWKIQKVMCKASRSRNPMKRLGYESRIRKLEHIKAKFQSHIEKGTLPKVVFGGRTQIGTAAYFRKRRGQFLSVGDGWRKGNQNIRIRKSREGEYELVVRNWKDKLFTVSLLVPKPYRRLFESVAVGNLKPLRPLKTEKGTRPYTIRILRRKEAYECHLSVEVPEQPISTWNGSSLASLDVNPTHIDIVILNECGNLIASRSFAEPALIYGRRHKRLHLASQLAERVLKWGSFFGTNAIVIEELGSMRIEHGAANRIIANFMHDKLLRLVAMKALRREWILVRVPTAYSSRVAVVKYKGTFPRISIHQLAALVLGRRALGLQEHLTSDQLETVAGHVRKRQASVNAIYLHGHRHPHLILSIPADGRISLPDVKGAAAFDKWVTPHTRYAAKEALMQRLSWLMPPRHFSRRAEAARYDGRTRAHRGNAPCLPLAGMSR